MTRFRVIFMVAVAAVVLLLFGAGIYEAARYSLWVEDAPKPDDMPKIVSYFVSAVNGTLAANLGAVLGITVALRGWRQRQTATVIMQWIAAIWYVIALVCVTMFWGLTGFTEDEARVVTLLPEMTKNGIGILVAILAAVLGVETVRRSAALRAEGGGEGEAAS